MKVTEHPKQLWSKSEFEAELRNIGKIRYHDNCRFHHLLHSGMLN